MAELPSAGTRVRIPKPKPESQVCELPPFVVTTQGTPVFRNVFNPIGIETPAGTYFMCQRDGDLEIIRHAGGKAVEHIYPAGPGFLLTLAGCRLSKHVDAEQLRTCLEQDLEPYTVPVVPAEGALAVDIKVCWHRAGKTGVLRHAVVED
jgi:hypothetical protein